MALIWLIHEWLLRLASIRHRLAEDARDGRAWMLRIEARILRFLVARYDHAALPASRSSPYQPADEPERPTFCIVTPRDHPPRRGGSPRRTPSVSERALRGRDTSSVRQDPDRPVRAYRRPWPRPIRIPEHLLTPLCVGQSAACDSWIVRR